MLEEHTAARRRITYGLLFVLTLLGLIIIILRFNTVAGPNAILAGPNGKLQGEPEKATEQEPEDPNDKRPIRPLHKHPAFAERLNERVAMVSRQIEARAVLEVDVIVPIEHSASSALSS